MSYLNEEVLKEFCVKRLLFMWSIVCLDTMGMNNSARVPKDFLVRAQDLVHAVLKNDGERVNILLQAGVDINKYIPITGSALGYAADLGNEKIIERLLQHGAVVDMPNEVGDTPLFLAAYRGYQNIVEILLKNGAAANNTNKNGQTPLMAAIFGNHVGIAKTLITHGADLEKRTRDGGKTALHLAVSVGRKELIELLLMKGAKVNRRDWEGKTALTIAKKEKSENVTELLIRYGGID